LLIANWREGARVKNRKVSIRASEHDRKELEKLAGVYQLSMSDMVRFLIIREALDYENYLKASQAEGNPKALTQLIRIGGS